MNKATILLCGDHSQMTSLLERALIRMDYHVTSPDSTQSPLMVMQQQQPDLALVDDLAVCRQLRENRHVLPILFYSSYDDPQQVVQALDQGADDYIVVPFAREEFAARIRAQLRRAYALTMRGGLSEYAVPEMLQSADGSLCLNAATYRVQVNHQEVHLTRTEFHLLHCFLLHAGKTLTYDFLLKTVWGPEYEGMEDYVRVYIRRLRQKIEPDPTHPTYLRTQLNQGYVFSQPEEKV